MIVFENVEYVYPNGVKALRDVNLRIGEGEVVAIMGENGAGKTTLLKHLNGLLKPTKGRVLIQGIDTKEATVAELSRKVGIVFQNAEEMFFSGSVWEETEFALRNFGFSEDVIRRRVEWTLRFMELWNYKDKSPFMLSGGEKKRLALSVILAWSPEIIVLDEPTLGQDQLQKEKMMEVIKLLNTQGKTVILSSHDIEFVAELKPRVILMKGGKIVGDGPAEKIMVDLELLESCSLIPPQMVQLTSRLEFIGIEAKLASPEDIARDIMERIKS